MMIIIYNKSKKFSDAHFSQSRWKCHERTKINKSNIYLIYLLIFLQFGGLPPATLEDLADHEDDLPQVGGGV